MLLVVYVLPLFYHIGKVFAFTPLPVFFLSILLLLPYKLPTNPCSNSIMLPTKRRAMCYAVNPLIIVCYLRNAAPLITCPFMLRATHFTQSQLRPLWWLRVPALISSIRFNPVGKRKALAKIKVSCLQLIV